MCFFFHFSVAPGEQNSICYTKQSVKKNLYPISVTQIILLYIAIITASSNVIVQYRVRQYYFRRFVTEMSNLVKCKVLVSII